MNLGGNIGQLHNLGLAQGFFVLLAQVGNVVDGDAVEGWPAVGYKGARVAFLLALFANEDVGRGGFGRDAAHLGHVLGDLGLLLFGLGR